MTDPATPGDPAERAREFLEVHAPECCTVCADLCAVHAYVLDLDAKLRRAEALIADLSQGDAVVMENARLRTKLREAERQVEVLREAVKQTEPWLDYLADHVAADWSPSEAEVVRQDRAYLRSALAALTEEDPDA